MKILSEKDIQKLAANAVGVVTETGDKVQPYRYRRPEKPEIKKESKFAWLKTYLGSMTASLQSGAHERKLLNGLVAQIVKVLNEKPEVERASPAPQVVIVPWQEIDFDIIRDDRGFMKKIKLKRIA